MGLDLCHAILSVKGEDTPEYFYVEELDVFPGIVENHQALITEVIETDSFFTVHIFSDEDKKKMYEKDFGDSRHEALLVGHIDRLAGEISAIESGNGLLPADRSVAEDGVAMISNNDSVSYTTIKYPIGDVTAKVIYWKEIGYQRKRMSGNFYEDFGNCKLYFRKSDVLKAANCLSADREELPGLRDHFKAGFIDNFVEGESIFFASW